MEQYAIYLRKSRADDPNASIEETLSRHEKTLLETAKRMKLNIVEIYREVVSGESIAQRPEMQKLLDAVDQGLYKGVLVVELERLARGNSIDQGVIAQSFQLSKTNIVTPNKVLDPNNEFDAESIEFGLFMSRREYKTITRRLQQGRLASVKEGKYLAPGQPYGYLRTPIQNSKGMTLIPHPEQSQVVKLIFELYTLGDSKGNRLGLHAIATRLNELGIPSAKNGPWASSSIQVMLKNPIYCGKIRWNARRKVKKVVEGVIKIERPKAKEEDIIIIDGIHPAIISMETFELAADLMKNNRARPNPHGLETKNPLSGIIECALCGRKLSRLYHTEGRQSDTLMCMTNTCKNMSISLNVVEAEILNGLDQLLKSIKTQAKNLPESAINISVLEKNLKKLEIEQDGLNKQLEKTHDLLEQGIYDTATFLSRTKTISEKSKEFEQKKNEINEQIISIQNKQHAKKNIAPKINNIIKTYYSIEDVGKKNDLLKSILVKVTYLKTQRSTKSNPLGNTELILYPKD